jgi:DnaJ-like protein
MIFVALGVLALAALVLAGRWPQLARLRGRLPTLGLALVAGLAAAYDAARGGWLGGSILASTALWLVTSTIWPSRRPATSGMSRTAAAATLGVGEQASRAEIDAAYRRLMQRVHPDKGGAAGLAVQLNAARDVMLGKPL